ncbi:Uncharacterized conserved domain linked to protein kinase domain [Lymphocystis disease virus 1]|uniref:Uncharacterized conserved domain linked to protein kinase domain n=1 Tax=Fish lymphocystis disease virus TaxID=36363 RepID=UPI0000161EA4|nr:Uncharacterized conserved domain linked to protein kinase domain [Lymphocystis disease virus 1]
MSQLNTLKIKSPTVFGKVDVKHGKKSSKERHITNNPYSQPNSIQNQAIPRYGFNFMPPGPNQMPLNYNQPAVVINEQGGRQGVKHSQKPTQQVPFRYNQPTQFNYAQATPFSYNPQVPYNYNPQVPYNYNPQVPYNYNPQVPYNYNPQVPYNYNPPEVPSPEEIPPENPTPDVPLTERAPLTGFPMTQPYIMPGPQSGYFPMDQPYMAPGIQANYFPMNQPYIMPGPQSGYFPMNQPYVAPQQLPAVTEQEVKSVSQDIIDLQYMSEDESSDEELFGDAEPSTSGLKPILKQPKAPDNKVVILKTVPTPKQSVPNVIKSTVTQPVIDNTPAPFTAVTTAPTVIKPAVTQPVINITTVPINTAGPSNLAPAGPSNLAPAGPSNLAPAGPSNLAPAGPAIDLSTAGPSNLATAGPAIDLTAGPSNLATAGPAIDLSTAGPSNLAPSVDLSTEAVGFNIGSIVTAQSNTTINKDYIEVTDFHNSYTRIHYMNVVHNHLKNRYKTINNCDLHYIQLINHTPIFKTYNLNLGIYYFSCKQTKFKPKDINKFKDFTGWDKWPKNIIKPIEITVQQILNDIVFKKETPNVLLSIGAEYLCDICEPNYVCYNFFTEAPSMVLTDMFLIGLTVEEKQSIILQLLCTLAILHGKYGIIHNNIALENIYLRRSNIRASFIKYSIDKRHFYIRNIGYIPLLSNFENSYTVHPDYGTVNYYGIKNAKIEKTGLKPSWGNRAGREYKQVPLKISKKPIFDSDNNLLRLESNNVIINWTNMQKSTFNKVVKENKENINLKDLRQYPSQDFYKDILNILKIFVPYEYNIAVMDETRTLYNTDGSATKYLFADVMAAYLFPDANNFGLYEYEYKCTFDKV